MAECEIEMVDERRQVVDDCILVQYLDVDSDDALAADDQVVGLEIAVDPAALQRHRGHGSGALPKRDQPLAECALAR
jgi:hypothetical protein